VVPPTSSGATGIVTAAIDDVAKTMAVAVNTLGITGTEAHLHEGAPGVNGGVLTPLVQTSSGIWSAKVPLTDSQINSALNGNFYVEVHSLAFPAGELRGQVAVLERVRGISDCRFGGFGVDNCVLDDGGFFFVGFGFGFDEFAGGFIPPDFAPPPFGFDGGIGGGMDGGIGGGMGGGFIGGGFGFDTPAPGIFLPLRGKS
jgi:hypothetical protein